MNSPAVPLIGMLSAVGVGLVPGTSPPAFMLLRTAPPWAMPTAFFSASSSACLRVVSAVLACAAAPVPTGASSGFRLSAMDETSPLIALTKPPSAKCWGFAPR